MKNSPGDFCFCTLALGSQYHILAQDLARDIQKYAPGKFIVIGTDHPDAFRDYKNVIAFEQNQTGIRTCYNDKRFVLAKSLLDFESAILLDADTKLISDIPANLQFSPGITAYHKNVLGHLQKYRSQDVEKVRRIAAKMNISMADSSWIAESLVIVTRDGGKEQEFIKYWGIIARYLELRGMYSGEGNIMGLAATKVGLKIHTDEVLQRLNQARHHLDNSQKASTTKVSFWEKVRTKINYYYRLSKTNLVALKDFYLYYG